MFRLFAVAMSLAGAALMAQPGGRHMGPPGGPGDFAFLGGQFGFAGKVVTGAPYTAQRVTQVTQTLSDGTHIQESNTATLARDSQGRTRVEETLQGIGRLRASSARSKTMILIHDPVASMSYMLDPTARTVHQTQISSGNGRFGGRGAGASPGFVPSPERAAALHRNGTLNTEDLGTQVVSGVNAQGKRVTHTIAAGEVGNDQPINIVTETWYSPDLQIVVMMKSNDPRFGERTYTLNNISRAEPDPALFNVPSGYTVEQGRPNRGFGPPPPPAQ